MSDILQLLTHPAGEYTNCLSLYVYYYTIKNGATDHVITEEGVAALDFLIGGYRQQECVFCVVIGNHAIRITQIRLFQGRHLIELSDFMDSVYCLGVYEVYSFIIGGVAEGSHEH